MGTEMMRLRYVGGKSVSKIYFNRIRYVFNKENNFTANVPSGAWIFVKETHEFVPAPVEEKPIEFDGKGDTVELEKPDETVCDICGFKAKTLGGAKAHKRIKHKEAK